MTKTATELERLAEELQTTAPQVRESRRRRGKQRPKNWMRDRHKRRREIKRRRKQGRRERRRRRR